MAIEGGSDNSQQSSKLYTGLENFKIVAVCPPTLEVIKKLGYNFEKEPSYVSEEEKDGAKIRKVRIDFYLDNVPEEGEPHLNGIMSYFMEDVQVPTKDGSKLQYTNTKGQFAYLADPDNKPGNMQWFESEGIRPALRGEEMLVTMLRNYSNVNRDGKCSLDNPKQLFAGNFSEIVDIKNAFDNKIKVLMTIKKSDKTNDAGEKIGESYFQAFYTRKVERPYSNDFSYLRDDITKWQENGGGQSLIIPDFPYTLQEWAGVTPTETAAAPTAAAKW